MKRRSLARLALAGLCTLAGANASFAQAQDYPSRTVRIVAPLAPGGAVDILARILAERLQAQYGQPVIVENKPGASGHLGAQFVAKSPGDGYTLMVGTIGIHAAYGSYKKLTYNPATELQPIAILGEAPNLVVVPANSPYKNFGDFLADVKAHPGKINYASAGAGTSIHMVTALFELASGTRMAHVPYKGSGPALVDLMAGQVQVMFVSVTSVLAHIRAGKMRALAVTTRERIPALPDVPTVGDTYPGFEATSWVGLLAPAGVPADVVSKLNGGVNAALKSPEFQKFLDEQSLKPAGGTPEQFASFMKAETQKWGAVIKRQNIQVE